MAWAYLTFLEGVLFSYWGGPLIVGLLLAVAFLIGFIVIRVDFRYSALLCAPLLWGLVESGWLPFWVGGVVWVMIIGVGLYYGWSRLRGG